MTGREGVRATTRPILPSSDLPATARFYADLDFDEVGHWPEEYLILRDGHDIELHFWHSTRVDRWTNDVACCVGFPEPSQVRELHRRWSRTGVAEPARLTEPEIRGHLVEFDLIDLHGNLVRVGALRDREA